MNRKVGILTVVLICIALGLAGCNVSRARTGETRTEAKTVPLGAADAADVEIKFEVGRLQVSGGADGLMTADFRYNVVEWQPEVTYSEDNGQGNLAVKQPSTGATVLTGVINEWDVQLNGDLPLALVVETGAGESQIDLSALDVTEATVKTGVGSTTIDLTGDWQHDLHVAVSGGVGKIDIDLPAGMGVQVKATPALGGITANGLTKSGDNYTNDSFGTAQYTLTLDLEVGVGSLTLNVVE